MSLIYFDPFEDALSLGAGRWSAGTIAASGRNGNRLQVAAATTSKYTVPAADEHATMYVGFAVQGSVWSSVAQEIVGFYSDTNVTQHVNLTVVRGATNITSMQLRRGTTVLATSSAINLPPATWAYIELKAVLHDTTGVAEVKMNGTVIATFSGDTKNAGTKTVFDTLRITGGVATSETLSVDDLYLLNGAGSSPHNDYLGDVAVEAVVPGGNGSLSQLVGSDGNSTDNYLLVDDAVMTDYVGSAVTGDKDLYAMGNLVRATGTVYGVMVAAVAQNADAAAQSVKLPIKSGATTSSGSASSVTTSPSYPVRVLALNPVTAAAWIISEVNAVEAGAEVGG